MHQVWQPIETAPVGLDVLVTGWLFGNPETLKRWHEVAKLEKGVGPRGGDYWFTEFAPLVPPTHWMPLPASPESAANDNAACAAPKSQEARADESAAR